jgi:hypothetical protein
LVDFAQVVGIEWPGDEGYVSYMPLVTSITTFSFFFPEDEEHALESGPAISGLYESKFSSVWGAYASFQNTLSQ